jgi:hypothetical protein
VQRPIATAILAVISGIFGVLGLIGLMGMVFAILPLAAPGGYGTLLDKVAFACIMAFSPTCAVSLVGSWAAHNKNRYWLAIAISLAPFVPLGILAAVFLEG